MITITESARIYLKELLDKQEDALGVRVFINNPGTPRAETCIAYCREGDKQSSDEAFDFDLFQAWIEARSLPFLEDAVVDYAKDKMGGQLTIKAPNIKGSMPSADAPLSERVSWVLETEINPGLAGHGGMVMLESITERHEVILRFGGGCHGCGMADVTLKDGIETTLKGHFPEITAVLDATDHSTGENPYYAPNG